MSTQTRQSNLFAAEDWRKLYNTFRSADFQSYDYETLRKSMVDYLRTYYPEDFNDYIESSEFIALLDLLSFMGQSISYRSDLNYRENFIQTAERRDSVYRMANMLGYSPSRNNSASGMLKVVSVQTTQQILDSNGTDIANRQVKWNDPTNQDWLEQFTTIVNSVLNNDQRIGRPSSSLRIGGVRHDLYEIKTRPNQVPMLNFNSTVDNISMPFNIYNVGLKTDQGVYERAPQPGQSLGFLYKNDGEGNASINTGYFMGIKQGVINNLDFSIDESLPNRVVSLNVDNINNSDVWLYELSDAGVYLNQWTEVDDLRDSNVIFNDITKDTRTVYSVYSRVNDQADLIFGDGVFSEIPVGLYRAAVRTTNGLSYSITPNEMQNIKVEVPYITNTGKVETLRLTLSLQYTINNASTRESLAQIKTNAPQSYYTQNRMINGEDYNTLPYVKYSNILKLKAVNRTSSGISRFLEIKDVTGKYSSTNIFCEDGYIYYEEDSNVTAFNWLNASDIQNFISNTLSSLIKSNESVNLYYTKFTTKVPETSVWVKGTADHNTCSGFFVLDDSSETYNVQQIGRSASNNRKFIEPGALMLFRAPSGYYFDIDRVLTVGTPSQEGQVTELWASVKSIIEDGTGDGNGWLDNQSYGPGPVVLSENIPTGAELIEIYPVYDTILTTTLTQSITRKIINNEDFALRYDFNDRAWKIVNPEDVDKVNAFSLEYAGNTTEAGVDASWQILMTNTGTGRYSVYHRGVKFFWGSEIETRFYYDPNTRVYDSRNGTVIDDQVRVLTSNTKPDTSDKLDNEYALQIYNTVDYADGYSDDSKVIVTFNDRDNDGVPDNPRVFDFVVDEDTNPLNKLVYFEKYTDYDNFERYRYFDSNKVVTRYTSEEEVNSEGKYAHAAGTVFYVNSTKKFYELQLVAGVRTITLSTNYIARVGRDKLSFQYRHNSGTDRRIDPSPTNIIDMYVLAESYNKSYREWLSDKTGKMLEPEKPTLLDMTVQYRELDNLKSISDSITYSPASFKILFGSKAPQELQAIFKVVRVRNSQISNSEIRTRVIDTINEYFEIDNWDFGDTFFFSELGAYIHNKLAQDIGSIVIVPKISSQNFGDLFQITSEPNEIFVSSATVDDVEIVDSVTSTELRNNSTVNIFGGYTPTTLRT